MKKVLIISLSALAIVALLAALHSRGPVHNQEATHEKMEIKNPQTKTSEQSSDQNTIVDLEAKLHQEAQKISQLDSDPDKTQRELEVFADQLSSTELHLLKDKVINTKEDGDTRSLAVYLLSLSQSEKVLELLKEIALNPLPDTKNDRLITFEETLRASTIDGLVRHPNKNLSVTILDEISKKSQSRLIADRSRRGFESRTRNLATPEEQEQAALQKLLGEKSR